MNACVPNGAAFYDSAMQTIGDRIEHLLEEHRLDKKELGLKAGLGQSTISTILQKFKNDPEGAEIRSNTAIAIANTLGVRIEWLLTGKGTIYQDPQTAPEPRHASTAADRVSPVATDGPVLLQPLPGGGFEARYGQLANWQTIAAEARAMRPNHPEWVWRRMETVPLFLAVAPSPANVAAVADLLLLHEAGPR